VLVSEEAKVHVEAKVEGEIDLWHVSHPQLGVEERVDIVDLTHHLPALIRDTPPFKAVDRLLPVLLIESVGCGPGDRVGPETGLGLPVDLIDDALGLEDNVEDALVLDLHSPGDVVDMMVQRVNRHVDLPRQLMALIRLEVVLHGRLHVLRFWRGFPLLKVLDHLVCERIVAPFKLPELDLHIPHLPPQLLLIPPPHRYLYERVTRTYRSHFGVTTTEE